MRIALVGNQNCGKTTLFNSLTGSNQKVGNWPGVTIEQKRGYIKGTNHELIDLPGIYSLSPYTPEEKVSRDFVLKENVDLIINIIDATNIERSLYLTTMLLETNIDVIVALNMADILEKSGIRIDVNKLEQELKTTVVSISALRKTGISNLIDIIKNNTYLKNEHQKIYSADVEAVIEKLSQHIDIPHPRFSIVKMLECDPEISLIHPVEIEDEMAKLEQKHHIDCEELIADQRYQWITNVKEKCTEKFPVKESITRKLDKVLLNKWLAIPIFIALMGLVYLLSVGIVGHYLTTLISDGFNNLKTLTSEAMLKAGSSAWSASLMSDGIIGGVGAVLAFLPQIVVLFCCISFLEASGYMSRIAFFFDNIFHRFGLSGKSLIPFIVGSGCSVPGIMTSRIVEDDKEKRMTVILTPLIPCSAKLPIISLFAGFIVGNSNAGLSFLVAFLTYIIAIILILLFSILLNKIYFKSNSSSFLSELPEYKLPSLSNIGRDVLDKSLEFIKRAGTIILFASIIVWFLLSFTWTFQYVDGTKITIENSMLGGIGKVFAWFFYPMTGFQGGNNTWAAAVSAIQGLVAKEEVVSSMQVIASKSGGFNNVFGYFQSVPVTAVAYLYFVLYSAPCFGAIGATYKETGSVKKTIYIVLWQIASAWVLASMIGGFGTLITLSIRGQL